MGVVREGGIDALVSKSATRWQQRAASDVPRGEKEGDFATRDTPLKRGARERDALANTVPSR